jgi:hypothetical protein
MADGVMSSPTRCRTPRKAAYLTRAHALSALRRIMQESTALCVPTSVYYCTGCRLFHLSSVAHGSGIGRRP